MNFYKIINLQVYANTTYSNAKTHEAKEETPVHYCWQSDGEYVWWLL